MSLPMAADCRDFRPSFGICHSLVTEAPARTTKYWIFQRVELAAEVLDQR
jgi:hypothetical protein